MILPLPVNIFFDLDGTLIDSRQRVYQLFQHLVPQSQLSFDDYWRIKSDNITHETLLKERFGVERKGYGKFEKSWMNLIETEKYLDMDQPFDGTTEYLIDLNDRGLHLFILTARQLRQEVIRQIDKFGWTDLFEAILVTEQKVTKEELLKPFIKNNVISWVVGDTGNDINAGKILNLKTVAVLSGFQSYKVLAGYKPDLIVDNVIHFTPF